VKKEERMNFSKFIGGAIASAVVILTAGAGWAEKDCEYNGVVYSHGSFTCQTGYGYKCNDGSWDVLKTACSARPHESSEDQTADSGKAICGCSKDERNLCYATGQVCSADGDAGKCVKKCK
jgi:hypothetical protein